MSSPVRLLQVEDCESDAALTVRLLEKAGYEVSPERVETAPQMRAALARQAWDIVIADYHLPHFDAPAALSILRDSGLDIPFIVVSGAIGEDRAVDMMKSGAHDYVMKNNLGRLAPAVAREIREAGIRRERGRGHRLLDAVFKAQLDALIVCDTDGVVVRSNPAAAVICGFDPDGMAVGCIREKLQLPAAEGRSPTLRALTGDTAVSVEQSATNRVLEISSVPMRDVKGEIIGAVTIARDITEKKLAEERLRQAQKLESIALLAGGIAHDFNNILTVVSSSIELALEDSCPDCNAGPVLEPALESLQRAACLTRQLLAYAGKGAFIRKRVCVSGAGEKAVAVLLPGLPERVRLITDFASDIPPLFMDPGQMEQVFSNLILNAVEAIPDGQPGIVTVRTGLRGDTVCIEVSDNGCGIDAEIQKRIFDPFFTTKFPGRGLGLAAVEGIVRALDGRTVVESAANAGTRIAVLVPVPDSVESAPRAAALPTTTGNAYGAVLIVDDEPMIRKMAGSLLKKRGIPVLEAGNGKEAIERLAREGGNVRAILLDMAMPEVPGDAALPMIRQLRPDVRVIVSSGFQDRDVQQHFSHIDACRFLPKPYTPEQLFAEIMPVVSRP
jgi:PAS domain S-box-containing protein